MPGPAAPQSPPLPWALAEPRLNGGFVPGPIPAHLSVQRGLWTPGPHTAARGHCPSSPSGVETQASGKSGVLERPQGSRAGGSQRRPGIAGRW